MTSFPPSRLNLPTAYQVIQVASGLHHSGKNLKAQLFILIYIMNMIL